MNIKDLGRIGSDEPTGLSPTVEPVSAVSTPDGASIPCAWTPGPWSFSSALPKFKGDATEPYAHDGLIVTPGGEHVIARLSPRSSMAAVYADARLIAAAPDLYAALAEVMAKEQRRYENNERGQGYFQHNNAGALAALAKARGEAS